MSSSVVSLMCQHCVTIISCDHSVIIMLTVTPYIILHHFMSSICLIYICHITSSHHSHVILHHPCHNAMSLLCHYIIWCHHHVFIMSYYIIHVIILCLYYDITSSCHHYVFIMSYYIIMSSLLLYYVILHHLMSSHVIIHHHYNYNDILLNVVLFI